MKYIVMDMLKDRDGDIFTQEFDDREEAIADADMQWHHLTNREKSQRYIIVIESVNPDEDADDHFDGEVVYELG